MQVGPPTQQSQEPVSPQGLESWETVFLGPFLLREFRCLELWKKKGGRKKRGTRWAGSGVGSGRDSTGGED